MITYKSLTPTQRRYVDSVLLVEPNVPEIVTRDFIMKMHEKFKTLNMKVALPNWMMSYNQVGRGQYAFPFPEPKTVNMTVNKYDPLINQYKDLVNDQA